MTTYTVSKDNLEKIAKEFAIFQIFCDVYTDILSAVEIFDNIEANHDYIDEAELLVWSPFEDYLNSDIACLLETLASDFENAIIHGSGVDKKD